jgi:DNA-binding transcriptional regulator YiaG
MDAKLTDETQESPERDVAAKRKPILKGTPWLEFTAARKDKGYKQKDLAKALGVHLMTVSGWERGLFAPDRRHWSSLNELLALDLLVIANRCAFFSPASKSDL